MTTTLTGLTLELGPETIVRMDSGLAPLARHGMTLKRNLVVHVAA